MSCNPLNNEILWRHDVTHDNMSSHDIRGMTSMHDFISIKLDIWLLLYMSVYRVSELERWFYFCFARYLGREIQHSKLSPFACPSRVTLKLKVTSRSIREFCYLCLYSSYRDEFRVVKVFRSRKSFQISPFAWPLRLTLKLKVTSWSTWFLLVFVLPRWICCLARFLYCICLYLFIKWRHIYYSLTKKSTTTATNM